ncbi:hypothetical protein B0O80DRAFT_465802 [Mortierella sp. GBAus27b]|nr:hypothetical protein B0O80DRAFT_465802 [Mortierella sp. GBAus27b]
MNYYEARPFERRGRPTLTEGTHHRGLFNRDWTGGAYDGYGYRPPKKDPGPKTEQQARGYVKFVVRNYLSSKNVSWMLGKVGDLKKCYRPLLVTEFVEQSMMVEPEGVNSIVQSFNVFLTRQIITAEDFEAGFAEPIEYLAVFTVGCPNAYEIAAQLLTAAGMNPARAAKKP